MERSTGYILMFSTIVCLVCSVIVSGSAVTLKPMQIINRQLDQKKKVLGVVDLYKDSEAITPDEINQRFADNIEARLVNLKTGEYVDASADEIARFDQGKAQKDPAQSTEAPDNPAKVQRIPNQALVYLQKKGSRVDKIVLPVEGKGLWGTLYGYIALESDTNTIAGITFYKHKETPGLGGEVDNPDWQAKWSGRKAYDVKGGQWTPKITVRKGAAGTVAEDPYQVDGLSGATITSRGVGHLLRFWLADEQFGTYLSNVRNQGGNG